jgi:hypothetical protein
MFAAAVDGGNRAFDYHGCPAWSFRPPRRRSA